MRITCRRHAWQFSQTILRLHAISIHMSDRQNLNWKVWLFAKVIVFWAFMISFYNISLMYHLDQRISKAKEMRHVFPRVNFSCAAASLTVWCFVSQHPNCMVQHGMIHASATANHSCTVISQYTRPLFAGIYFLMFWIAAAIRMLPVWKWNV